MSADLLCANQTQESLEQEWNIFLQWKITLDTELEDTRVAIQVCDR